MGAVVEAIACGRPVEDLREGEQVSERMGAASCYVPALVPATLRALAPGDEERGTMVHAPWPAEERWRRRVGPQAGSRGRARPRETQREAAACRSRRGREEKLGLKGEFLLPYIGGCCFAGW
jgi:hypothetical protein